MDYAQKSPGVSGRNTTIIMLQNHVFVTQVKSIYRWATETEYSHAAYCRHLQDLGCFFFGHLEP
jgi:hypothetical protein